MHSVFMSKGHCLTAFIVVAATNLQTYKLLDRYI